METEPKIKVHSEDENPTRTGWECPRCGDINSPDSGSCSCVPEEEGPVKLNWDD